MKNRLLALVALCGATSSTLPLWAADWADPELTFVKPDLDGIKGGQRLVYYVYHVASEKFMSNGADYNTTFIVSNTGQEVTLSYGPDYELITHPQDANDYSAAKSYRLSLMNAPSNGGFHEVFLDPGIKCYVDHSKQGHILWDIVPQDNGLYRIRVNVDDPLYGTNKTNNAAYKNTWIGVNPNTDGGWNEVINPLIQPGTAGYEKAEFDWKFVEPEVYEVYAAKKNVLKPQLEAADEAGYTNYAKYKELYESDKATVEQIEDAAEELKDAVLEFKYSSASETSPADLTAMIKNASFESADGWTSWRANNNNNFGIVTKNEGEIGTSDGFDFRTFFERWVATPPTGDYYIEQSLSELPDGKYRLKAYIMTQQTAENGGPKGLFLYAKTVAGESKKEADTPSPDGSSYAAPYTVDFSVIGGTATVGMRSEGSKDGWSAVGYFTLQYMGKAGAITMRDALNQNITEAEQQYANDIAGKKHSKEGDKKYEEMIALAKEAVTNNEVTDDSLQSIANSLLLRMDSLVLDVNAYKTLNEKINTLNEEWENSVYVDLDMPDYDQFLTDLETAYSGRSFDPAEIDSIQPRADRLWKDGVRQGLKDGLTDNVTGLLSNPNFTGNNNGWTYKFVSGDNKFNHGNDMAEVYQTVCDVYQELEDMPSGTYEVTLQGFYRPSWNGTCAEAWGIEGDTTNDILAYAYGNDTQEKLRHVFECVQDTNTVNNCEQLTTGGSELEGKWVPNGMASAAAIMTANSDNYRVSFKCYVEDDGKLRLGITIPKAGLAGYWALFDNFQVTYHEGDMSGAEGTLNALIEKATDLVNQEGLTTQEAKDGLHTAIEAANEAMGKELTLETYTKNKTALNEAIEVGQAALDAAAAFETLVTEQVNNFDTGVYDDYSGAEYDAFQDLLLDKMQPVLESLESVEQIEGYTVEINEAYAKMVASVIETSTATLDTPVEMTSLIQSPSFSTKAENGVDEVGTIKGWSTNGNQNASGALNYEFWQVEGADIHQTLYALPKGYYRLTYNGFYRAGGFIAAGVAHRDSIDARNGEVYLESGEGKWTEKLASIFDNINEYKYSSGDVVLPDSLFPASTKLYNCMVNDVTGADLAFKDGKYEGTFSFYVSEAGQPTLLGVRKTAHLGDDWLCFDNFKLLYYGDGDTNKPDDFVSSVEEAVADGKATVVSSAWYTINGVRVAEPKQRGIYIRQDKMSDGTTQSVKVMVR